MGTAQKCPSHPPRLQPGTASLTAAGAATAAAAAAAAWRHRAASATASGRVFPRARPSPSYSRLPPPPMSPSTFQPRPHSGSPCLPLLTPPPPPAVREETTTRRWRRGVPRARALPPPSPCPSEKFARNGSLLSCRRGNSPRLVARGIEGGGGGVRATVMAALPVRSPRAMRPPRDVREKRRQSGMARLLTGAPRGSARARPRNARHKRLGRRAERRARATRGCRVPDMELSACRPQPQRAGEDGGEERRGLHATGPPGPRCWPARRGSCICAWGIGPRLSRATGTCMGWRLRRRGTEPRPVGAGCWPFTRTASRPSAPFRA